MASQNLFYITTSVAVIFIAFFYILLGIIAVVIAVRIAKAAGRFLNVSKKAEDTMDKIKEKVTSLAFMGLVTQGLKEIFSFVKAKKEEKENNENKENKDN